MITSLTLLAAIVPGLLICYFIVRLDKYEQEPWLLLLLSFGLGIGVFFSARYFEGLFDDWITPYIEERNFNPSTNIGTLFLFAFVRTAFIEEFLKIVVLLLFFYRHKEFNEPMDGIVYAVMIGMGFAVVENILYCFPHDLALALVRDFTAVPAHAVFGVILGYYVGLAKFNQKKQYKYILLGFALTVGVHGLYDIFLFQEYEDWLMILATLVLLGGLFYSRKFISRHQKGSFFRPVPEGMEEVLDTELAYEKTTSKTPLQEEDNEILSAVLYEMKKNQEEE